MDTGNHIVDPYISTDIWYLDNIYVLADAARWNSSSTSRIGTIFVQKTENSATSSTCDILIKVISQK